MALNIGVNPSLSILKYVSETAPLPLKYAQTNAGKHVKSKLHVRVVSDTQKV